MCVHTVCSHCVFPLCVPTVYSHLCVHTVYSRCVFTLCSRCVFLLCVHTVCSCTSQDPGTASASVLRGLCSLKMLLLLHSDVDHERPEKKADKAGTLGASPLEPALWVSLLTPGGDGAASQSRYWAGR